MILDLSRQSSRSRVVEGKSLPKMENPFVMYRRENRNGPVRRQRSFYGMCSLTGSGQGPAAR